MQDSRARLREAFRFLFPEKYLTHAEFEERLELRKNPPPRDQYAERLRTIVRRRRFDQPPLRPADVFAASALLLMRSGAYHHIVPCPPLNGDKGPGQTPHDSRGEPSERLFLERMLTVSLKERKEIQDVGRLWRGKGAVPPAPPDLVVDLWQELQKHHLELVYQPLVATQGPPEWWRIAFKLMSIADEASANLGFDSISPSLERTFWSRQLDSELRTASPRQDPRRYTLSSASPDVICVLPKSRAPRVGCTIRNLSHNLAALPPHGLARASWIPTLSRTRSRRDAARHHHRCFNILLLPYPYVVRAKAFQRIDTDDGWGWFQLDPTWCEASDVLQKRRAQAEALERLDEFSAFVRNTLDQAEDEVGQVHALVLPESALSWEAYHRLVKDLQARPNFELLVSGLFDAPSETPQQTESAGKEPFDGCHLRSGNFAAMTTFRPGSGKDRPYVVAIREKHHRWRLDSQQIATYSLGSSLDSSQSWWEKLDILSRSLDVFVLGQDATVTTLICEDLARNDPCQELVRGIGPTLVITLLMDGAQLRDRWPARYATVLAEDPGSAVLTLTSFGMIDRTNRSAQKPPSRKIGLWRDDSSDITEIELPPGHAGVVISAQPSHHVQYTLDGRPDHGTSLTWRLSGVVPIPMPTSGDRKPPDWIPSSLWSSASQAGHV